MSEDMESVPVASVGSPAPHASEPDQRAPRRGAVGWAWMVALVALAVAAVALWRVQAIEHGQAAAQTAIRNDLNARLDEATRNAEQRKRDLDSLRARVSDADGVNKSVREELLGLGERSRHLEDAVANLAEQRLSGRDALAMNEAEFLLQQAQERLTLFHDAQAAIAAYQLADSALAAAEDPVFASVRQTIGTELRALQATRPASLTSALAALERVRESLATLPPPAVAGDETTPTSRLQAFLRQFVHISHSNAAGAIADRDIGLVRSLAAIDLRAAEAALLARDATGYSAALKRSRAEIVAGFDANAAPTKNAIAELERLAAAPLAPALPDLGSALKELRNLRATRVLTRPPSSKQAAPAAPDAAPDSEDAGT